MDGRNVQDMAGGKALAVTTVLQFNFDPLHPKQERVDLSFRSLFTLLHHIYSHS